MYRMQEKSLLACAKMIKKQETLQRHLFHRTREKLLEETKSKMSLDDLFTQIQEGNLKELDIVVKQMYRDL